MSGDPREQKFVPGLDKGLKAWLRMREEIRSNDEMHRGEHVETIPEGIKYKYHNYWNDISLLKVPKPDDLKIESMEQFEQLCRSNIRLAMRIALKATHNRFLEYALLLVTDINESVDAHGNTALHIAAFNGDAQKLRTILDVFGIKINALNKNKITPLLMSIREPMGEFHKKSIQEQLIKHGANINLANSRGFTPLHEACLLGNMELIKLLLQNRAHVYILDKKGKVPIQYAHKDKEVEIHELFRKYIKRCGKPEHLKMWSHILSRQFVTSVFILAEPSCIKCKRKIKDCETLKLRNFRYWLLVHDKMRKA